LFLVRFEPALYADSVGGENFSTNSAGAARVTGSPAKPVEVGLGYAGGDTLPVMPVYMPWPGSP
jgi:hypothetical protein